jgi:5-methylcytosine-specific restriction endonuclease McrA
MKTCPRCNLSQPLDNFGTRKVDSKTYAKSWCKACEAQKATEKRLANPAKTRDIKQRSYQKNKEAEQQRCKDYYQANKKAIGLRQRRNSQMSMARESKRESDRRYAQTSHGKEAKKTARQGYRARRRYAPGVCSYEQWLMILDAHGFTCYLCYQYHDNLQVEHRTPLSRGGSNDPANLAPACPTCNQRKGSLTDVEYIIARMKGER